MGKTNGIGAKAMKPKEKSNSTYRQKVTQRLAQGPTFALSLEVNGHPNCGIKLNRGGTHSHLALAL
jgi:hypothetical protein